MITWLRHITIIGVLATLTWLFGWGRDELHLLHVWNRTVADAAYVLLCVTLMIGPVTKLIPALRPIVPWRRELGIAAAAGSLIHVIALTGIYGWDFLYFFARAENGQRQILANMYGAANWVGLVALVYAVVLALSSNDWMQRTLGQGWKFLQQQSYTLFVLAALHTALFIFVVTAAGPGLFRPIFIVLTPLTIALQLIGYFYTIYQRKRRRPARSES